MRPRWTARRRRTNWDENDAYAKVDVALRESLRVVNDAVNLSQDRQYWASNHAPLTAPLEPKG